MNSTNRLVASSRMPQSVSISGMMPSSSAGKASCTGWDRSPGVAAVGVDQPRLVEAVAAHHAADGVGDQPLDVFFPVGTVERDLVVGDFGREFVLQAVGFDEEAVVFSLRVASCEQID